MIAARKPGLLRPALLVAGGALLLVAATYNFVRFGGPAYFAVTGRPLSWRQTQPRAASAKPMPVFTENLSLSAAKLAAGETQTMTFSVTSDQNSEAEVLAWISGAKNKQIWKSPDKPVTFEAGKVKTLTYTYQFPAGLAPGTYPVSLIIRSKDEFTDYLAQQNVAEFKVE